MKQAWDGPEGKSKQVSFKGNSPASLWCSGKLRLVPLPVQQA